MDRDVESSCSKKMVFWRKIYIWQYKTPLTGRGNGFARFFYTETSTKIGQKRFVFACLATSNTLTLFLDHFRSHKFQKGLETADPETRIFTHVNSASSMKTSSIRGRTG